MLCKRLGTCHLSTGDVFRAAKGCSGADLSPAMASALAYMKHGDLVPDETVLDMISERLRCLNCSGGFLLDGFPRTVTQAKALEKLLDSQNIQLTSVFDYELPIEKIVARLSGRRTCVGCKAVYHVISRPPKADGVCDHCGGELIQREDDRPESVQVRMEAYQKSTRPLIDFYKQRGLLVTIAADGSPEEIYERTRQMTLEV
jgi:adenylate kinase